MLVWTVSQPCALYMSSSLALADPAPWQDPCRSFVLMATPHGLEASPPPAGTPTRIAGPALTLLPGQLFINQSEMIEHDFYRALRGAFNNNNNNTRIC